LTVLPPAKNQDGKISANIGLKAGKSRGFVFFILIGSNVFKEKQVLIIQPQNTRNPLIYLALAKIK
jgi:hypothetical protein